ncbi:RNA-binding protein [Candidatus Woesearchaeota archaeon]|nr:RNA-binding protein [Candidatus Woesearchaeota archaeon]
MSLMKRTQLRSKDVNKLLKKYNLNFSKKDQVELIEDEFKIILINKLPSFFYYNNQLYGHYNNQLVPTLKYLQNNSLLNNSLLKKVIVDMGAVKFIIGGADVMRPGIVELEEGINKDDLIVVVDQNNKKPLAVGIALLNSDDMRTATSGKVIKNIHYVGDQIWKFEAR